VYLATEMFVLRVYRRRRHATIVHITLHNDDVVKARKSVVKLPTPRLTWI